MSALELAGVVKRFGATTAVDQVSLAVERGEFVSLLGASGCGKTTTLRLIAGLETADAGAIRIAGTDVTTVPTYRRDIGMVFQSLALFPHMSVAANVGFGLRMRGQPASEIARAVTSALELVRLAGFETRLPASLSGGQQQRVALARALASKPAILLLDEPFSALDRKLREELTLEFAELLARIDATTVFVTHDQEEAFAMSRRVAVMQAGRILQLGRPVDVFSRPADASVARFVGMSNLFPAVIEPGGRARCALGSVALTMSQPAGARITLGVRPEHVQPGARDHAVVFDALVRASAFRGRYATLALTIDGATHIDMLLPHGVPIPRPGERARFAIGFDAFHCMPEESS